VFNEPNNSNYSENYDFYRNVEKLSITCNHCNSTNYFEGINLCKDDNCKKEISLESIATQLILSIRDYIKKYYNGWLVCDEQTCKYRTKIITKNCINHRCSGMMKEEVLNNIHIYIFCVFSFVLFCE
jgi:DNA polymerase alpha subunit A